MATLSGKRLLTSLLVSEKGTTEYMAMGLHAALFAGPELELFEQIEEHITSYGVLPHPETIGLELPDIPLEPPAFYFEDVRKRYKHRTINKAMKDVKDLLIDKNPDQAEVEMRECLVKLMRESQSNQVVDFASDGAHILDQEYLSITKGHLLPGILTGYPSLDVMLNGLKGGDVLSIVGRPGQGKTYKLLSMAHNAWHVQKKRVLMVSMEMKPLPLIQRVAAMHEKMSITLLRKGEIMKEKHAKIMANMHELETENDKFWIVDGNLTSEINEVVMLARQLKPDIIFIDGAYLLKVKDRHVQRWERISDTIETIKGQISTAMGIPAVLTYQFNRTGAKEKELENIGGSDAIGQISSCVLALFESEDSSIESIVKKKVDIIKGRNGEVGEYWINWLFDVPPFMNFSEILPEFDDQEFAYL